MTVEPEEEADPTSDVHGQPYARLSQLRPGSWVRADSGFTCIPDGRLCEVMQLPDGTLYTPCQHGRHCLDGQLGADGDVLVGLYPAEQPR